MSLEYNTYLAHHGVKGQKWGLRRYQNEDGSLTAAGKDRYAKKSLSESETWTGTDPRDLTDDELRRRLTRLQQEKQYKDMTATKAAKVRKWVGNVADKVLVATAIGVLAKAASTKYTELAQKVGLIPVKDITKAIMDPNKKS